MSTSEQSHPGFTPSLDTESGHADELDDSTSVRQHRFRRTRQPKPPAAGSPEEAMATLLAELMLLREENAWLKAAQHQAPDIGQAIQRVRKLPADQRQSEDRGDDATQVLVEAHVLREALLELCDEVQRVMSTVHQRLEELAFREQKGAPRFEDAVNDELIRASVIRVSDGDGEEVP